MQNKGIRKQRDTSYSMTQRLLKKLGEGRVVEYWTKYGMYKSAELLSKEMQEYVSPYVLRYMSNKYDWKRHVNKNSPIYKGVKAGTVPAAYYKHLIFPEEITNNEPNK
ncbi:MAG: hypothetical protein KJO12_01750 [Ignavibacteria bacterium]|nr:hypothetical protein [Ignavibacteria bacterium]NNJ54106.1 hypothetical protein [Ignavibacteriaceae bacterium]